jgi:hypothetical protein
LKKEYKFVPPAAAADEKPDADGITDSMLEFSWERDVQASVSQDDGRFAWAVRELINCLFPTEPEN